MDRVRSLLQIGIAPRLCFRRTVFSNLGPRHPIVRRRRLDGAPVDLQDAAFGADELDFLHYPSWGSLDFRCTFCFLLLLGHCLGRLFWFDGGLGRGCLAYGGRILFDRDGVRRRLLDGRLSLRAFPTGGEQEHAQHRQREFGEADQIPRVSPDDCSFFWSLYAAWRSPLPLERPPHALQLATVVQPKPPPRLARSSPTDQPRLTCLWSVQLVTLIDIRFDQLEVVLEGCLQRGRVVARLADVERGRHSQMELRLSDESRRQWVVVHELHGREQ